MIDSLVTAFRAPDIRRKILFTLGILFIFRVLTNVPVAGVDQARLSQLFESNQLLGLLDLFSGGGLATASIIGMGVNPYINASIIMRQIEVFVKGPGAGREQAIRSLQTAGLEVTAITDVTPIPHNGCRPPKRRRV